MKQELFQLIIIDLRQKIQILIGNLKMFIRKLKYTIKAQGQFKKLNAKKQINKPRLFCQKICIDPHQEILAIFDPFKNSVYIIKTTKIFELVFDYIKNSVNRYQSKRQTQIMDSQQKNHRKESKQNQNFFRYSIDQPLQSQIKLQFGEKTVTSFYFSEKFDDQIQGQFQYLAVCYSERYKQFIQIFDVLNGGKSIKKLTFESPIINISFFRKQIQEKNGKMTVRKQAYSNTSKKSLTQLESEQIIKINECQNRGLLFKNKDEVFIFVSFYDGKLLKIDLNNGKQEVIYDTMMVLLRQRINLKQIVEVYQTHRFNLCINKSKLNRIEQNFPLSRQSQKDQINKAISNKAKLNIFDDQIDKADHNVNLSEDANQCNQKLVIESGLRFFDYSESIQQFQGICNAQMSRFNSFNDGYKNLIAYELSPGQQFIIARNMSSLQKSVQSLNQQRSYHAYHVCWEQAVNQQNSIMRTLVKQQKSQIACSDQKRQRSCQHQETKLLICQKPSDCLGISIKKLFESKEKPFINPFQYQFIRTVAYTGAKQSKQNSQIEINCLNYFIRIQQLPKPNKQGKQEIQNKDGSTGSVIAEVVNLKNQVREIVWIGPLHLLFRDIKDNLFIMFIKQETLQNYLNI